jgi:hypothetical protein
VFLTNRPEDQKMFNELRGLSQAVIQNGGSLHDIIELYSTDSVRKMKKVFKSLKDKQDAMQQQQLDMQQQQQEQQQEQVMAQLQQAQEIQDKQLANDNYQAELDRINKKEIALIAAESKSGPLSDMDTSGVPDVLEISKLAFEQSKAAKDYQAKINDIQSKNTLAAQKLKIEKEKNQIARENMANDLAVAKVNAKNRASKKTK